MAKEQELSPEITTIYEIIRSLKERGFHPNYDGYDENDILIFIILALIQSNVMENTKNTGARNILNSLNSQLKPLAINLNESSNNHFVKDLCSRVGNCASLWQLNGMSKILDECITFVRRRRNDERDLPLPFDPIQIINQYNSFIAHMK